MDKAASRLSASKRAEQSAQATTKTTALRWLFSIIWHMRTSRNRSVLRSFPVVAELLLSSNSDHRYSHVSWLIHNDKTTVSRSSKCLLQPSFNIFHTWIYVFIFLLFCGTGIFIKILDSAESTKQFCNSVAKINMSKLMFCHFRVLHACCKLHAAHSRVWPRLLLHQVQELRASLFNLYHGQCPTLASPGVCTLCLYPHSATKINSCRLELVLLTLRTVLMTQFHYVVNAFSFFFNSFVFLTGTYRRGSTFEFVCE